MGYLRDNIPPPLAQQAGEGKGEGFPLENLKYQNENPCHELSPQVKDGFLIKIFNVSPLLSSSPRKQIYAGGGKTFYVKLLVLLTLCSDRFGSDFSNRLRSVYMSGAKFYNSYDEKNYRYFRDV